MNRDLFSKMIEEDSEYIPIITNQSEEELLEDEVPELLPILPLRNMVLFPGVIIPIAVGRKSSLRLVREAFENEGYIGVVAQRAPEVQAPELQDLYEVGTMAEVMKILEMPDGSTSVILQGRRRMRLKGIESNEPYLLGRVEALPEQTPEETVNKSELEALMAAIREAALKLIKGAVNLPNEMVFAIKNIEGASFLLNFIGTNMGLKLEEKQELLAKNSFKGRAYMLLEYLSKEVKLLELKTDIQSKVKSDIDQQQREYLLQQEIKTLQHELGGMPHEQEIADMREKAQEKLWSDEVATVFDKELTKLERLNPNSADFSVQMNYVQTLLDLPWDKCSKDFFDLGRAEEILDEDHYGLEKVKERIIEHLAVLKLKGDMKSPIICLHGPPGVGKTSLGKSVARALSREYVRMSLGGLHDESEIRGHRRTYIGAMPGRVIFNIKKAGTSNPVFVLDEIDKVKSDFRGDPQAALLEVLDPEQNNAFHDNFLDIDYDLSKVLFIATANNVGDISQPLLDRMELIEVSGYIIEEKIEIAKRHLIPKAYENHGLKKSQLKFSDAVLETIISGYTRESGVRQLDKKIATVMRKVARKVALGKSYPKQLSKLALKEYLGPEIFSQDRYEGNQYTGVVTGLAWTATGGDILYIESSKRKGKGAQLSLTGNLGQVMKESATLALEYLRSHAEDLNIANESFEDVDFHIHVPEGAIPKDGPSAGITMAVALASSIREVKVKKHLAMTGEITLRGKVLPVGGIKEKLLAAKRAGIKEVILCSENRKNVEEINAKYVDGLEFHYVDDVKEVLRIALES